jgi:MarR family transcriptional regulator for hemolysin
MDEVTAEDRQTFARELAVVARRWRARVDERLKTIEMSEARAVVLQALAQSDEAASQSTLAERAGVEAPTVVRIVDVLEEQQLVERRACAKDRRVNIVHLSPAGRRLLAQINTIGDELRREVMADLAADEVQAGLTILRRLRQRLDGGDSLDAPVV